MTAHSGSSLRHLQIAIHTAAEDDLHALAIQQALETRGEISCHIIAADRLPSSWPVGLTWSTVEGFPFVLPTTRGEPLDVRTLDLVWWRRVSAPKAPTHVQDPVQLDLIANDCRSAVEGVLHNEFHGTWVNDPQATRLAENKLIQLRAAERAGFHVPLTLVSQEPEQIRRFSAMLDGSVVVKPVRGTTTGPLLTTLISPALLDAEASMRLCPATYQEYIKGQRHVRAHCFGPDVHTALIESEAVDWRANLDVPVRPIQLPEQAHARLRQVLGLLGLRMGVVDLKLTDEEELVWLEINPQGQFLFIEGLCGLELTAAFSEFLHREAIRANIRRAAASRAQGTHTSR